MLTAPDQGHSEHSTPARPFVPKWPFILGDIVLILVALALSFTAASWSEAQMFFCLGAVGLGAALLATPFALEAFPPSSWRIFGRSSQNDIAASTGLTEGELRRQARAATEAVEHAARANAALETSARRFDARFAPLAEVHKNLEALVAELREAAATRESTSVAEAQVIQREFDRLRKEQAEKFKAAETKIAALQETLGVVIGHLQASAEHPAPSAAPTQPEERNTKRETRISTSRRQEPTPVAVEAPVVTPVVEPALVAVGVMAESPVLGSISASGATLVEEFTSVPSSAPSVETKPEAPSMLAKALATAQSASESSAVSDIIQSRSRRSRKSKPHLALDTVSAPVESVPVANMIAEIPEGEKPATVAVVETSAASFSEKAGDPPHEESASSIRRTARAKAIALRDDDEEEKKDTPNVFTPPVFGEIAAKTTGPTQGELLAREADTIRRKRATKNPLSVSTLTARILIGIGNKPFIRGDGPGLSQDKGVPMEFVEIGQWRWVAPKEAASPITLRILKNDEIPAEGDPITLKPGQILEVSPTFPG